MSVLRDYSDTPLPARDGESLELVRVMERVQISLAELATATGISKTTLWEIGANNRWPKTTPPEEIKESIEQALREAGADDELLRVVWWARRSRRKPGVSPTDQYGRGGKTRPRPAPEVKPYQPKATDMLLAKKTLSHEARAAFSLFTNPFDGEVTCAEELFANGELRFVREAMLQTAKLGRLLAVVGESGSGKTTLLGDLEERVQRDGEQLQVIKPYSVVSMTETEGSGRTLKATDIVNAAIMTIDPHATVPISHEARIRKMASMVGEGAKVGQKFLLVIEEAHTLSAPTLRSLKRLSEYCRFGRTSALGILLLAQPELLSKLNERRADLREVVQRFEIVTLPPLDGHLRDYLTHRLKALRRPLTDLFDESGIAEIQNRLTVPGLTRTDAPTSLLYPLAVNNLVTAALNEAAALGVPLITRDVVRAV